MNKIISLFINDTRFVFRESILFVLAIAPVLIISFIKFLLPFITSNYLPVLADYYPLIIAMFCLITSAFPAYAISFIMLDEKDENIFSVLRVMPISFTEFLLYRLGFVFLFGFLFSFLTLDLNGLIEGSLSFNIYMAFLFALLGPVVTLFTVAFASSKVEGLTILKGLNFLIVLPLITGFIDTDWKYLLGVIPPFWSYQAFVELTLNTKALTYYGISLVVHLLVLSRLIFLFKKNVFRL